MKSIVFRVAGSDRHVLFLTGGDARVDPGKAAALAGVAAREGRRRRRSAPTPASRSAASRRSGICTPIETWFDPGLLAHPVIWAAAGTPNHVFAVDPVRLQAALGAPSGDFTELLTLRVPRRADIQDGDPEYIRCPASASMSLPDRLKSRRGGFGRKVTDGSANAALSSGTMPACSTTMFTASCKEVAGKSARMVLRSAAAASNLSRSKP